MEYDASLYPPFAVTVDLVVLTIGDGALQALLVRRGEAPYRGRLALPGGFVRPAESLGAAARRELAEETGIDDVPGHLEQLATYGDPGRDPRMRVVSVAYLSLAPDLPAPSAGGDARQARWLPVDDALTQRLAFDHVRILADGVERARSKLEYTTLATSFCPPEFTIADLRHVYDVVWGTMLDPRNFHRKCTGTPGFVEPVGRTTTAGAGRPAQVVRAGPATALNPPILRPG
jgi:8-oxo-dGTP diphosphatase